MARLDPKCKNLREQLGDKTLDETKHQEISYELGKREKLLLPIYNQISVQFADLHDRSTRMKVKGAIRSELEWREARRYFFWRIRRKLNEEYLIKRMNEVYGESSNKIPRLDKISRLRSWYDPQVNVENDREVSNWIEANYNKLDENIKSLKMDHVAQTIARSMRQDHDVTMNSLVEVIKMLSEKDKEKILKSLNC